MIWLIGAGPMSMEYARVLNDLNVDFRVVGRGKISAAEFQKKTGKFIIEGGLQKFISTSPGLPEAAIVSVGVESLAELTGQLVHYGVKKLLVEKPAGVDRQEIQYLDKISNEAGANVYIGYNRRFYSSVERARQIIEEDGGVNSLHFEFTEWSHVIGGLDKPPAVKRHWFLANSTHVVDLAFYLGGKPEQVNSIVSGKNELNWHEYSIFTGAGRTENDALFSYCANWVAPGRWSLEVLTGKNRLILCPLEKLKTQKLASINIEEIELDDRIDRKYKPGLFNQVSAFLEGEDGRLCQLSEHCRLIDTFYAMAGYADPKPE